MMLEANKYQMEELTFDEWSDLPGHLQWIPLPDYETSGVECSHLCWNTDCVNTDHIVLESHKVRSYKKNVPKSGKSPKRGGGLGRSNKNN